MNRGEILIILFLIFAFINIVYSFRQNKINELNYILLTTKYKNKKLIKGKGIDKYYLKTVKELDKSVISFDLPLYDNMHDLISDIDDIMQNSHGEINSIYTDNRTYTIICNINKNVSITNIMEKIIENFNINDLELRIIQGKKKFYNHYINGKWSYYRDYDMGAIK